MDTAELPGPAADALFAYLRASNRLDSMTMESPLFASMRNPTNALDKASAQRALKEYAVLAGLDPTRISLHSFRHTACQERFAAGSSILDIQKLCRHSSLGVTFRYMAVLVGEGDSGAQLLQSRFGDL